LPERQKDYNDSIISSDIHPTIFQTDSPTALIANSFNNGFFGARCFATGRYSWIRQYMATDTDNDTMIIIYEWTKHESAGRGKWSDERKSVPRQVTLIFHSRDRHS
jgi:hypothetical protein